MGLYSWFMAQCYDAAMQKTEQLCLHQWRSDLLGKARGTILEIGAGTGINLQHYPGGQELILCEPDQHMRKKLHNRLRHTTPHSIRITDWRAEQLELPNLSIDTVVSTLVLCSVDNQSRALQEIFRVLRPGGQLLFIEHVLSDKSQLARWQKLCEPVWRCACGNCHLTRPTAHNITACGLAIAEQRESKLLGAPAIAQRVLHGCAEKTDAFAEIFVNNGHFDPTQIPSCPTCQSADVAKILYGKPPLTRQILAGLESGKIISGGCMIHSGAPEWHCHNCQNDFGHHNFAAQKGENDR